MKPLTKKQAEANAKKEINRFLSLIKEDAHKKLNKALNSGCIIFSDLTYSSPQPTAHHNWDGENWIDARTEEEKLTEEKRYF